MKTVENRLIPLKEFIALAVWPIVFVRSENADQFDATARRHEGTHLQQQMEVTVISAMLLASIVTADHYWAASFGAVGSGLSWWLVLLAPLAYYVIYLADWLLRLIVHRDRKEAYRNIVFEQEAYAHERDENYLRRRRSLAWLGYAGRKTWRNPRKR